MENLRVEKCVKAPADSRPWVELALCRDIYGILQTLATRPLSKGHDGAVLRARERLKQDAEELARNRREILGDSQLQLLRTFIHRIEHVPPEVVARTLIGPLGDLLGQSRNGHVEYPCSFVADLLEQNVSHLVVTVGPTIGLGDEILAARALIERGRSLGKVSLLVSTHHFGLWSCQPGPVTCLPPPPVGAFEFIESLPLTQRDCTAFLFIDFLSTDLHPEPYSGPPGIAYGGRWAMGNCQCDILEFKKLRRHRSRYPEGLPECRWLEARWMAGRVLRGAPSGSEEPAGESPPRSSKCLLLQPLTAKPGLTFPPEFYHEVFVCVTEAVPELDLQVIPSPTRKGQALIEELLEALRPVVPSVQVTAPEATALADVVRRLSCADVLFGPDTFTGHLAALLGVPQVTISLPEHRAWRTVGSPALGVVAGRTLDLLADACARRIVAFLNLPEWRADRVFASGRREWQRRMRQVDSIVREYLHEGQFDPPPQLAEAVLCIRSLYEQMAPTVHRMIGDASPPPACSLDLSCFDHSEDMARALARWYHAVALSDVAGILGTT